MTTRRLVLAAIVLSLLGGSPRANAGSDAMTDSIGMKLVKIPAGTYRLGRSFSDDKLRATHRLSVQPGTDRKNAEEPGVPVKISQSFYLGATEVTVGQFRRFVEATGYQSDAERTGAGYAFVAEGERAHHQFQMKEGFDWRQPSIPQQDDHPVVMISQRDAQAFCQWLSEAEDATYRLPTEAEWEWACQAGDHDHVYTFGDDPETLYQHANIADAALYQKHPGIVQRQRIVGHEKGAGDGFVYTAPVGSLKPNAFGLYDMHGNVHEWTGDIYSEHTYERYQKRLESTEDQQWIIDPAGPQTTDQQKHGDWRVIRGGSWQVGPLVCRCNARAFMAADLGFPYLGFRVVREIGDRPGTLAP